MPGAVSTRPERVTVLGPQRRPNVDQAVRDLPEDATVAAVTAGWREREQDDGELLALLGGRGTNLRLHTRWLDVLDRDLEYALAEREHQAVLDELQDLYLVELDHALRAAYTVSARSSRTRTRDVVLADALDVVRLIDARHLDRVRDAHARFTEAWDATDRPLLAEHRADVADVLARSAALVVAGGHVGVLGRLLRLFGCADALPARVVAWSAGAMALTDCVVLFNDRAAHGPAHSEVSDDGLGVVRGVVLLPHARRRLHLQDLARMSLMAARFAPARCVVLDDGVRVDLTDDLGLPAGARVVDAEGRVVPLADA